MPRAFSQDYRVIDAVLFEGQTRRGAAERFGVSPSTAVKWVQAATDEKHRHPVGTGGHRPSALPGVQDWLLLQVQDHPDQTLKMLCSRLLCEKGVSADPSMLYLFFKKIGISFKKTLFASEQDRPDIADRRNQWKKCQKVICADRLVFIDETWAKTNMTPTHGWGPRGQPLRASAPGGHWKAMTFIAALRHDRIVAPCVFDGTINTERFLAWTKQSLVPTLSSGDVVIMDNLSSHKSNAVRQAIQATGAKLFFLPPYSPDLNPIEQVFAKLKRLLLKAKERKKEHTWRRIGKLLDQFKPEECANYLKNSGYA